MRALAKLLCVIFLAGFLTITAQAQPPQHAHPVLKAVKGFPHDWSHHHLIFSKPRSLRTQQEIEGRPRYLMQQAWRNRQLALPYAAALDANALALVHSWGHPLKVNKTPLHRDWSENMGTSAAVGKGMYPAKFSFDTGSANCGNASSPDFVVYNTGPAGAAAGTVTFSAQPSNGDTVTMGGTTYTFEGSGSCGSTVNCVINNNSNWAYASNLAAAVMNNSALCGFTGACFQNVSASNSSVVASPVASPNAVAVTLTAITKGAADNSISLATTGGPRITVSGATLTGGADTLATIVAYDNIYSGCSATVPTAYWQYDTGYPQGSTSWDSSKVTTSVELSADGSQVAFVQSNASNVASLVILKWAPNSTLVQMDTSSTNVPPASYRGCFAPCMTRMSFDGSPAVSDTRSSPFYDYSTDALYVGDDNGSLHKFTNVFGTVLPSSAPAEAGSPWPILVDSGNGLSSPIYDSTSGNILVGDNQGVLSYVRESTSTVGSCVASQTPPCLGATNDNFGHGEPITDLLVDSTAETVFAFLPSNAGGEAEVLQSPISSLASFSGAVVGDGSRFDDIFAGDFDNNYYSGNYALGHLYVCGTPREGEGRQLYSISFNFSGIATSGFFGPNLSGPAISDCSAITEFFNGGTDRIFLGIQAGGIPSSCGDGCVASLVVTGWQPATSFELGQEILDSNGDYEKVTIAGTSGMSQPSWPAIAGNVSDGSVQWTNQGAFLGVTSAWQSTNAYSLNTLILDSNFNLEQVTRAGISGSSQPAWLTLPGLTLADATVRWTDEGPGNQNLAQIGGPSGIVIDNAVAPGTLPGASEVYFSTLGDGLCPTSGGTGGCAVQASQQCLSGPTSCSQQGLSCGTASDGCGNVMQCGTCASGEICVSGTCQAACTPLTCAEQGFNCGPAGNGCGGMITTCGTCTFPDVCGGGGVPGVCGEGTCTSLTCAEQGINCGPAGDGCGGLLECGSCTSPDICGGGGVPGVCGIPH